MCAVTSGDGGSSADCQVRQHPSDSWVRRTKSCAARATEHPWRAQARASRTMPVVSQSDSRPCLYDHPPSRDCAGTGSRPPKARVRVEGRDPAQAAHHQRRDPDVVGGEAPCPVVVLCAQQPGAAAGHRGVPGDRGAQRKVGEGGDRRHTAERSITVLFGHRIRDAAGRDRTAQGGLGRAVPRRARRCAATGAGARRGRHPKGSAPH